jgi:hypothetical protein
MITKLATRLVLDWVRWYTRDLPTPAAMRRREEVAADVNDHLAHERALGTADARVGLAIISRTVRGIGDDLAWRSQAQILKGGSMRLFVGGLAAALGLALLALALDSGLVVLASVAVLAVTGLAVFVQGFRSARDGDFVVPYFAILAGGLTLAALGCAAIFLGTRGDAPGLVLLGSALIASVVVGSLALGISTSLRT